jgi:outer membrane receptor for ferrienterochelin and colicins
MPLIKKAIIFFTFVISTTFFGQQKQDQKKITISGKIIEKNTSLPLEYATITFFKPNAPKPISGGISNTKGEFSIQINPGIYDVKFEFISFKTSIIKSKNLNQDTNLGTISLEDDAQKLDAVEIKSEKSNVEIKLDKKIYSVGKDLTARGGTATDVLNNVPSITIDSDGNVSLRGNENVRILIDGRPSNAVNVATALQTIPADAIDRVEVVTNPSSRYDAEGSAGILNIVLKKGKNDGINGSIIANTGIPKNNGISGNINFRNKFFNTYATIGYTNQAFETINIVRGDYLNDDFSYQKTINERNTRTRDRSGYNYNIGIDLFLSSSLVFTNSINNTNSGLSPENNFLTNNFPTNSFIRNRYNDQSTVENNIEYNSNIVKKFKKDGHKLTFNNSFSEGNDNNISIISDFIIGQEDKITKTSSKNFQNQNRHLIQMDYVLPLKKESQFEAGFKIENTKLLTDFDVSDIDQSGNLVPNPDSNLTNILQYIEKVSALYSQFGSKTKKLSYLMGLRLENSNIDINLLTTRNFNNKNYNNIFPSLFLTYSLTDQTNIALNYSRRIARPRGRFINPFSGYSSNINLFQGNPDINPALTDAINFEYLTKINKITLTTSIYYNYSKSIFQFIRRPKGVSVESIVNNQSIITPVILLTPVNLDHENRFGLELTLNYAPLKWWKLNSNVNFFQSEIRGNTTYTLLESNEAVTQNFNASSFGWFAKINSKINLPYKIDWQTNATYTAPQKTPQGTTIGILVANIALSKDVLKDKATIALTANDIFNSSKIIREANLPKLKSYFEFQRRPRQITLSFTYRFNKKKTEREGNQRQNENGPEMM